MSDNVDNIENVVAEEVDANEYDEVLSLTPYDGDTNLPSTRTAIAEYSPILVKDVNKTCQDKAKSFIDKVTKFIMKFNDADLTDEHREYMAEVSKLQTSDLRDMLVLVEVNKQMLTNIFERINASQLEDYALINTYNMMVTQHVKLMKELQNQYRNAPAVLKRMKMDIMTDSMIDNTFKGDGINNEVITEDYGDTQFNSHKELLKTILKENK